MNEEENVFEICRTITVNQRLLLIDALARVTHFDEETLAKIEQFRASCLSGLHKEVSA